MRKIMDHLLALQRLHFDARARTATPLTEVEKLRTAVPPSTLARFERFVARGKKGVAVARNGVCSECHLRITEGKMVGLSAATDVQQCDNCGRYLYLPEGTPSGLTNPQAVPPVASKRARKEVASHVA